MASRVGDGGERAATRPRTVIAGVESHLPERRVTLREAEERLARLNPGVAPPPGMVERATGVRAVHVGPPEWQASDLAVAAAGKLLAAQGLAPADLDLVIFASASQDMVEPATAHIVADKLGATCPVMDVKNACNSVLNAVEVADALIAAGRYRTVLVACGEMPSRAVRWHLPDRATFFRSAPGYTMSDGGAALILRAATPADGDAGILARAFAAESRHWTIGTLPAGGTAHPRDVDKTYFDIDGTRLREAFLGLGPATILQVMAQAGLTWDDVALVAVHQVAVAYLDDVAAALDLPPGKTLVTVGEHGNLASATLPLQLVRARESGRTRPGDVVVLVGLAGGISIGAMAVRL